MDRRRRPDLHGRGTDSRSSPTRPGSATSRCPSCGSARIARSRRRRSAAAAKLIALPRTATARISAALIAAGLVGQTGPLLGAAQAATTSTGPSSGAGVRALQRDVGDRRRRGSRPADPQGHQEVPAHRSLVADGVVGPLTRAALGVSSAATTRSATATEAGASGVQAAPSPPRRRRSARPTRRRERPEVVRLLRLLVGAFKPGRHHDAALELRPVRGRDARSSGDIQAGDLVFFNTAGPGASTSASPPARRRSSRPPPTA